MTERESLIESIYEAAALSDRWPAVLEEIGRTVQTPRVALMTRRSDAWIGHAASAPTARQLSVYLATDIPARSQTTARLLAADRAGFLSNLDLYSPDEWEREPFRAEWGRRHGWNHCAATAISVPSGDFLVFHAQRLEGEAPFEADEIAVLDRLRPHLARAGMLAVRCRLQRLQTAAAALGLIGLPAAVLDRNGHVLAANQAIQDLSRHVRWRAHNRLCLVDARAEALLREALTRLDDGNDARGARSFAARSMRGDAAVIHVLPAVGQARDIFDGGLAMVIVTPVSQPGAPDTAVIRGLFDLSASEARVARALARGTSIERIAGDAGVSRETVRSQVKAVLAKTNTSRQAEVASLLAGLPRLAPREA